MSASYYSDDEREPENLDSDVESGMDFYIQGETHVFYDTENPMAWIEIDSAVVLDLEGGESP